MPIVWGKIPANEVTPFLNTTLALHARLVVMDLGCRYLHLSMYFVTTIKYSLLFGSSIHLNELVETIWCMEVRSIFFRPLCKWDENESILLYIKWRLFSLSSCYGLALSHLFYFFEILLHFKLYYFYSVQYMILTKNINLLFNIGHFFIYFAFNKTKSKFNQERFQIKNCMSIFRSASSWISCDVTYSNVLGRNVFFWILL